MSGAVRVIRRGKAIAAPRPWKRGAIAALSVALVVACAGACSTRAAPKPAEPEDAGKSPNATILPAPLATAAPTTTSTVDASPGDTRIGLPADSRGRVGATIASAPTPQPILPGQALPADSLPGREASGVSLTAEWSWTQLPQPPHAPEVSAPGIDAARKATRRLWAIDIADYGRMRVVIDSPTFVITRYSEIRARYDRTGHVLVWPEADNYRVVPAGALRALLDERRMDLTPLMQEKSKSMPSAGPKFGFPTGRTRVSTASGTVVLDQATVVNAGIGGTLLCRTLLELAGADPSSTTCAPNLVPVRAEYTWPQGGGIVFEVLTLNMRTDFPVNFMSVPPPTAAFSETGLPPVPSGIFLTREQVAAMRTRAIESPHPRTDPFARGAPAEGFVAVNETDALRFILIDGVPVAWVPPHGQQYLIGTAKGRYVVQWRTFLGSFVGAPTTAEFPALLSLGGATDAGTDAAPAVGPDR